MGVSVKTSDGLSVDELVNKFVEEQEYYLKLNACRFPFVEQYLGDDTFLSETRDYIEACKKYYEYKKSQEPLKAKQKEFEKKKREFLKEVKMSKQPPTKKQLYYYERLCKKYNIEQKDVTQMSRLDIRDELDKIINEHSGDCKNINR